MKKTVFMVAAAASAAWMTVFADSSRVVYQNDFATRTSEGAVPYGGWRAVNYVAGQLLANTNYSIASQFVDNDLQDNWLKAPNTGRSNAYIDDDGGNYVARLGDDSTKLEESPGKYTGGHVMIRQRIGNTFTNGALTITFDLLPPSSWWYYSGNASSPNANRCARLALGNEDAYSVAANSTNTMLRVGACYYSGSRRVYQLDGNGTSRLGEITAGHWLRYVVTVDMDTRKWGFDCYDLGTSHPTMGTATPSSAFYSASDLDFASTDKPVTSISTVSIDGYAVLADDSAARFDNIRIAHNGVECYVNDFCTRKSRNLAASTVAADYAATNSVADEVGSTVYKKLENILPSGQTDYTSSGLDGWKRRNGKASLSIIDGNQNLSVTNHSLGNFVIGAHPIGMTAVNGILRFRGDLRTPPSWSTSNRYAYFLLGGDQMYTASTTSDFSAGCYLRVGFQETNTFYRVYSGGNQTDTIDKTVMINKARWYRVYVTVNLDQGTYGVEIYDTGVTTTTMGASTPDGTLVVSYSNLIGNSNVNHISCYGVAEYGALNAKFDNIKISYTPSGSSEEELIYSNLFNTRTIYRREESMIGTLKSSPTGMDGWTRLGTSTKTVSLSSDGNAALVFGDGDATYATAVHHMGGVYGNGAMTAQADICAPTDWQDVGGCANIWFGNDQYHEGNLNGGVYNYEKMAAFGFGITNTTFAAFRGDRAGGGAWETSGTTTAGHWYRFVVSATNRASDVSVYDMGTDQPTLATATPATPVATFDALPFRVDTGIRSGISCVGVSAMGVKNPTAWSHLLPGGTDARLKIDNLRVSFRDAGTVILIK